MTDFYVDPDGNFVNSGASGLPVKTLQRAHDAASNGDIIYVQNTTEANPVRLPLVSTKNLTIRPAVAGEPFYCTATQNLSHGATYERTDFMGIFTSNLNGGASWATGSTPAATIDAATKLYGAGSLSLAAGIGQAWLRQSIIYYGQKVRFRVVYKTSAAGVLRIRMEGNNGTARSYNFTDQAWGATGQYNNLPTSTNWAEWVSPWVVTSDTDTGFLYLDEDANNETAWIQEVHMEAQAAWGAVGDGSYQTNFIVGAGTWLPTLAIVGRTPTYNTSNTALSGLFKGASWEASELIETNGSTVAVGFSYYNSSTKRLVYKPESGEDVTAINFHMCYGAYALKFTAGTSVVHSPVVTYGDHGIGITGTSNVTIYNPIERMTYGGGMQTYDTGVSVFHSPVSEQPYRSTFPKELGGGFVCGYGGGTHTASMTINGVKIINAGDDALQVADECAMVVNGGTSLNAEANDVEVSLGVSATGSLKVRNFTGSGAGQNGFRDQTINAGGCAIELINCGFFSETGTNSMEWSTSGGQANAYTVDKLYAAGVTRGGTTTGYPTGIGANGANVNLTLTAPPVASASTGDFTPTAAGAWQGTGTNITINRVGADGEPFQNVKPDVGGIQSKHGAFHPSKL